jgi:hypothetical protein
MAELRVKGTGTIKLFESDNTSSVTIASPASLGGDRTVTLPDADVTLVSGTMSTVALTGSTNNQVTTVTAANAISGETNLIYDGTILGCGATGASADLGVGIHVRTADSGASADSGGDELVIENSGDSGLSILAGTSNESNIYFGDSGNSNIGYISYSHSTNAMSFAANAAARMIIDSSGIVLIGKTDTTFASIGTEIYSYGTMRITRDSESPLWLNRTTSDGYILPLYNDGSFEGGISFTGGTIHYNAFVGSHWSRLADNSQPTILRGTVLDTITDMMDWYEAEFTVDDVTEKERISLPEGKNVGDTITHTYKDKDYIATIIKENNERLPKCKISDTEESKAVYGVFIDWDNEPDDGVNDMHIASLGAYVVRIHEDETVAIGDYLQSNGDGTAKVQADDIMRASTIGKVTSTEKTITHADGSYCVPCTLHCG